MMDIKEIKVGLNFGEKTIAVGRLALRDRKIYFEYDATFIESGPAISPLRLPLQSGVTSFDYHLFEGLPGVFNDSLPDGWGRLLFDRFARSKGILPSDITPLDRLAHVGMNALGALVYEPDHSEDNTNEQINLDALARQSRDVLEGDAMPKSNELMKALDNINQKHGRNTLQMAGMGLKKSWTLRSDSKSPCYTTCIQEVRQVKAI
jgi:serine/threonine-protein kinase HipA